VPAAVSKTVFEFSELPVLLIVALPDIAMMLIAFSIIVACSSLIFAEVISEVALVLLTVMVLVPKLCIAMPVFVAADTVTAVVPDIVNAPLFCAIEMVTEVVPTVDIVPP
jgi:hypothetical protein